MLPRLTDNQRRPAGLRWAVTVAEDRSAELSDAQGGHRGAGDQGRRSSTLAGRRFFWWSPLLPVLASLYLLASVVF